MKHEREVGLVSISSEDYHRKKDTVGHSALVKLMRSPAHHQEYVNNPPVPTAAMAFGTAVHAAVLEPTLFEQRYAVRDDSVLEGTLGSLDDMKAAAVELGIKPGKMKKDELRDAIKAADKKSRFVFRDDVLAKLYAGKEILADETMIAIRSIQLAIARHAGAKRLMANGLAEMSAFWRDPETGISCKCRPDWLVRDGKVIDGIVDLKTCSDASADGFSRSIAAYGYDVQAAFYQDGIKAVTGRTMPFYFLAVEKDGPHAAAVYRASDEVIEVGRAKYRGALQLLRWCLDTGRWPAYQPHGEIETIDLPRWAANFALES